MALAKAWCEMLKHTNAELGVDSEFTRPGIEALLGRLADDFVGCDIKYPFKWRTA